MVEDAALGVRFDADTEETVLLRAAVEGRTAAFEELVRRHLPAAYRVAALIAGPADAEDVTQDAMVRAHRAMGRLDPTSPFRPWLLAIVANGAKNKRRAARRYGSAVERWAGQPTTTAEDPADVAVDHERRITLVAAIAQLSEADQLVISCRYLMELSVTETSAVLRWPEGTVKSRLSRALVRLRDLLDEKGGQP